MNKYFSVTDTIFDLLTNYPILIDFMAESGFAQLKNPEMLKTLGEKITLEGALKTKKIDVQAFEEKLVHIIEINESTLKQDASLGTSKQPAGEGSITVEGLVPCPIRIPLVEGFKRWNEQNKANIDFGLDTPVTGKDELNYKVDTVKTEEELADVYISAGYEIFFESENLIKLRENGAFHKFEKFDYAPSFKDINLEDPKGNFFVISSVPAVFAVNEEALEGREFPTSWKDILDERFEGSVAFPFKDLDIFSAIIMGIYSLYGEEGVRKMANNIVKSLHPAQMVKLKNSKQEPAITVMPYFFANMMRDKNKTKLVWPSEGAILNPVYILAKESSYEKSKPFIDFLMSEQAASLWSANNAFPVTTNVILDELNNGKPYVWAGWDLLYDKDFVERLEHLKGMVLDKGAE